MKKLKGISLVELLIVMGIICLLLAIVIPAVKGAKERAESVKMDAEWRNQLIDEEYLEKDRKDRLEVNDRVHKDMSNIFLIRRFIWRNERIGLF